MYRRGVCLWAAATGGFSSAAFAGDDDGAYEQRQQEKRRLESEHNASANASSSAAAASGVTSDAQRPTIETYRAMTDEELITLLQTRERQVRQLRLIYENFHYEADKCFRTTVLDYHDKAMQLSQVHGKMQHSSLQINREALVKMREAQEMMNRDKRIILLLCTVLTFVFWVWVRRHYVKRSELSLENSAQLAAAAPSVTGAGSYGGNWFGSTRRSARSWETSWEKEVRQRREAQVQDSLQDKEAHLKTAHEQATDSPSE